MKNINSAYLFMLLFFALAGCAKEGAIGPAGKDGNANVKSMVVATTGSQWVAVGNQYKFTVADSAITQNVIDKGTVSVALSLSGTAWSNLPRTNMGFTFLYAYSLGAVDIYYYSGDGSTSPGLAPNGYMFKIVAITE